MCRLACALLCLCHACTCVAGDAPSDVTPPAAATVTKPTAITRAELAQQQTEGVAVCEVSDYVFGGYQGEFPSPPHADLNPKKALVILWKDFPFRFVFAHEASYCPWFELPSGAAVCYQFFEGNLGWAELFNNWGRQERNSFVEVLEPGPQRVWVRWTYFGVNMEQGQPAYRGTEDFWAYPNGLIVRRQTFDSLLPGDHHGYAREPMELIGLCPAGQRWCDVLRHVPGSDERHALAVLDVFSDKRYDVFWKPIAGTVWDSTHRRSGCPWQDLDDSPGVIMAIPMTDGTPFCAFGDNSGFRHDYTRLKDHTFVAEVWGSSCWDHWPIGWLNSQGHPVDADSLKVYPNHFSPLGMDFFALADEVVARGEFYSLLGVSGDNWEATRTSVRQWLEKAERVATPDSGADLPAVWTVHAGTDPLKVDGSVDQVSDEIRPNTARDEDCSPQVPLDYGQFVHGFQDDFNGVVRDPNWIAVPADRDGFRQANGVLRVTTMDANPSHLLYQASGYNGAVQEVLARICVRASTPGPHPVAGIAVASSPDATHAGEAINIRIKADGLPRIQVAPAACSTRKTVVIREDVHVRERMEWRDADYEIHGNVIFHEGGELIVERATVSLMCTYTREFQYQWEGGTLVTRDTTIGGAKKDGIVYQTNFEIQNGAWESEDTTIQYSSGVCMGWTGHQVKFHATRLKAGPDPDSIIMSSAPADVVLKDSQFNISLAVSARDGGQGRLDLPVDERITRVFDESNVPGVKYRLELINSEVALWWVFFSGIQRDGPRTEIVLGHCPRLIPSLLAHDLQGPLKLPAPWPAQSEATTDLAIGNLTLKTIGQTVHTWCWGLYLSGQQTDVALQGPTSICELFLSEGKLVMEGDANTYNALNSCTTVEVGRRNVMNVSPGDKAKSDTPPPPVELVMRNVALGRFMPGDVIVGQITAHTDGHIRIEHARCAKLKLMTKGNGTITMQDIDRRGELEPIDDGGAITIDP